jgi:stress response protein YsnF
MDMTTTVIGLYGSAAEARKAARAIKGAASTKQEPRVVGADGGTGLGKELVGFGFDEDTAKRHAAAVEKGSVLVLARVEDDEADAVSDVIDEQGALTLEEAENRGRNSGATTLEVVQEEAEVRKQGVTKGAVRVSRHVTETPFSETVTLKDRHVEVERHSADRELDQDEAEAAFEETTEEFVESSERAVVEKTARVVGEVTVSQETEVRKETVEGTLRRSDVEVEKLQVAEGGKKAQR